MDKRLSLKLNDGRHVQGILQGFALFMYLIIDECVEMATRQNNIEMGVIGEYSIITLEASGLFTREISCSTCPLSTAPVLLQKKKKKSGRVQFHIELFC
ncbi:small nuclear ribonucleoprotein G-like [Molossus nigricans]